MSYSKNYSCKFMQANLWHYKLFQFQLFFWIWKVWKVRGKITKTWISQEWRELFRWKNIFQFLKGYHLVKKLKFEEIAQDLSTQFVQNWYPKFTSNLTIFVRFILKLSSYFKTGTIFWVILKNIRLPWIQAKMQPKSQQVEWTRQIFSRKIAKNY